MKKLKAGGNLVYVFPAVYDFLWGWGCKLGKVACHDAVFDCAEGSFFQLVGKVCKFRCAVKFCALGKCSCLGKDCCHRVCGSLFALEVAVVVLLDGSVACFVFEFSAGADKD